MVEKLSIVDRKLLNEQGTDLEGMMWEEANICRGNESNSRVGDCCTNYNQCLYQKYEDRRMKCGFDINHFQEGGVTPI